MKLRTITPLIAIALVSCAAGLSNNLSANKEARDASIIISLKGDKRGDAAVKQQNQLCNQIASLVTDNFKVKDSYSLATNAILMDVPSAYVSDIRNLSFVSNVEYDTLRCTTAGLGENSIPLTTEGEVSYTDKDNASSDTMEKPEGTKDGEGVFIAILDTSFRLEHKTFTELDNDIEVKVTKESLSPIIRGSSFHGKPGSKSTQTTYWSNKVPFYYDYGGTATERTRWDVHDDLQVHGTHVASLAAGNDPDYKGIAPNAQLACMKVFTSASSAEEDVGAYDSSILAALEDCLALDVDIINMSLGNDLNDFEEDSAVRKVIKQLKEKDVSVCISAGNSGRGMYQQTAYKYSSTDLVEGGILSSYSNSSDAMIVASAQPDWQFYEKCLIVAGKNVSYEDEVTDYSSSEGEVVYKPERFLTDLTKEGQTRFDWVKVPGLGELKDYEDIDVEGKIAVVDRGEISFALKTQVAESKGAIAIFIINNDPTETDFTFRFDFGGYNPKIPVELVLYSDKTIFDTAGHGTLDILEKIYADNPSARQSSTYTSDGATFDLLLKPDISSPGNSIRGAISFADGDSSNTAYGALSGTSMASPNYAGALAVLISEGIAKKNLANITMSTAEPMKDDLGVHHRSPRIQGAGLINLDNALNSEIYLEGLDNDGSPLGSAKIQLQNNDDIKNGKVSLDFIAHSALSEAASLTATTYIYRPALKEYDAEQYPTLTGKFQGIEDDLIGTATQTITVNSGDTSISLNDYVISDTEKARIDENFEYGCSIEGFVFLTSKDFSIHVSIPFYGFYGDYSEAYPVEPFLWEREEGKTYQSDILNQFNIKALGLQSTDFRSDWVVGYYPNMDTLSIEDVLLNNSNLHKMKDYNQKPLRTICENESTGEYEDGTFYVGNNGATNTMIIQQFVTRSVTTNVITIKNKATGDILLTDHMFDSLYGADEDEHGVEYRWPLFKSHTVVDFINSGITAHRAYTLIPLYDFNDPTKLFPDGEYEIKFEYDVTATGKTFTKSYDLTITSDKPTIRYTENVTIGGTDYVRVRYNETNLSYALITNKYYQILSDSKGQYIDVPTKDFVSKNKIFIESTNKAGAKLNSITHVNDEWRLSVSNGNLINTNDFSATVTEASTSKDTFKTSFALDFVKGTKPTTITGDFAISLLLPEAYDLETLKVISDSKTLNYEIDGRYILFTTSTASFILEANNLAPDPGPDPKPDPEPEPEPKKGCGGSVIATSSILAIVSALGVSLLVLRKKKIGK